MGQSFWLGACGNFESNSSKSAGKVRDGRISLRDVRELTITDLNLTFLIAVGNEQDTLLFAEVCKTAVPAERSTL